MEYYNRMWRYCSPPPHRNQLAEEMPFLHSLRMREYNKGCGTPIIAIAYGKGVTKLDFHPLLRPHESRKVLQRKLTELLRAQQQPDQWQYLWETPEICQVCHMETNSDQPIRRCTCCYKQVHHVCLHNDDQAAVNTSM